MLNGNYINFISPYKKKQVRIYLKIKIHILFNIQRKDVLKKCKIKMIKNFVTRLCKSLK